MVPERIKKAIDLFSERGQVAGHFVMAVLRNNLVDSVGHADADSLSNLADIVNYAYNEIPGNCWGSEAKVKAWITQGGLQGKRKGKEKERDDDDGQSDSCKNRNNG